MLSTIEKEVIKYLLKLPTRALELISGGKTEIQGKKLDTFIQFGLLLSAVKPKLNALPPIESRQLHKEMMAIFDLDPLELYRVNDMKVSARNREIPIRIYTPRLEGLSDSCLLYFHGGGFVIGNLDTVDPLLRYLSLKSGVTIISVDYRLAPEHRFPAAFEDAYSVYEWLESREKYFEINISKMGIGGDSAGASIANYLSARLREREGKKPSYQLLIYPGIDHSIERESFQQFPNYGLTPDLLRYFFSHFFNHPEDRVNPFYFPYHAETLKGMPKTYLIQAGFDPLYDEGLAFHEKLLKDGNPSIRIEFPSLIHGFVNFGGLVPAARDALDKIAEIIRNAGENLKEGAQQTPESVRGGSS
ncbi:MAG: alpha/beta hydrolase [Leptospiraceae bacterium]|nr:alpha/beta hydrolase [Leptospiraceae bacterium]MCP5500219.1 alpha/beta hydrolase [Leptospiraceae bacterium]